MVARALDVIPQELRGEAATDFLAHEAVHPYWQK